MVNDAIFKKKIDEVKCFDSNRLKKFQLKKRPDGFYFALLFLSRWCGGRRLEKSANKNLHKFIHCTMYKCADLLVGFVRLCPFQIGQTRLNASAN